MTVFSFVLMAAVLTTTSRLASKYASIDLPISVWLVDFQAGVENFGRALAAMFGLSHLVYYSHQILIHRSAVLTMTSVHAYISLSMVVSESRALRKSRKHLDESLA